MIRKWSQARGTLFCLAAALSVFIHLTVAPAYGQAAAPTCKSIVQKKDQVEVTLSSPEPFYVGSRPFALHVGDRVFTRSQQTDLETESLLTFFLDVSEFKGLIEGEEMILVYGLENPPAEKTAPAAPGTFRSPFWRLGPFRKNPSAGGGAGK